jgi:drug/metabolite transporter (DMT)-like permease
VRAAHAPRLAAIAVAGAVMAPAALAWGLQRTGSASASLMLNLEAVFTAVLAWALYREAIGARAGAALALMTAGGAWLVIGGALPAAGARWGLVAVGGATLCWAADNALTRPLAELDPARVVRWKAGIGAAVSLAIAIALREKAPGFAAGCALLACGATGYGVSLRLYLLAQRRVGAARTGSIFAAAPFVGALVGWAMGDRSANATTAGVAALFAAGVALHLTEKHAHRHAHAAIEHEHPHTHDDGHHDDHAHDPPIAGEHSHMHRHEARVHDHPHAPDAHHQHEHR